MIRPWYREYDAGSDTLSVKYWNRGKARKIISREFPHVKKRGLLKLWLPYYSLYYKELKKAYPEIEFSDATIDKEVARKVQGEGELNEKYVKSFVRCASRLGFPEGAEL